MQHIQMSLALKAQPPSILLNEMDDELLRGVQ